MRNTIDEIALTNIKQETKYFRDFVQFPKQKYSPFLSLEYMFFSYSFKNLKFLGFF